jgi:nicotinamide-nucleotide amidase
MASGARQRFEADFALSVTGIAGPGGGSPDKPVGLVFLGLADSAGAEAREVRMGEDSARSVVRVRAARAALNGLRLRLLHA